MGIGSEQTAVGSQLIQVQAEPGQGLIRIFHYLGNRVNCMHGIQSTEAISFLVGAVVTQVRVGLYDDQIYFENDAIICIQSSFQIQGIELDGFPQFHGRHSHRLLALIGEKVERLKVIEGKSLLLGFSKGLNLVISDDDENFEAFQIFFKGEMKMLA
jgi:Family of unknown function (DUF6188)